MSLLASTRFVRAALCGPRLKAEPAGLTWPADLYRPEGPARGTLVFAHGLSPLGRRDPRQVAVCSALAEAGFRVVAPQLPALEDLRIDLSSLGRLRLVVDELYRRSGPAGGLGLVGPSFSGALALRVAQQRPGRVRGVLAIGSFGDTWQALMWAMTAQDADPYARNVLFWNFVEKATGPRPGLRAALRELVLDEGLRRERPRAPATIERLDRGDRRLLEGIQRDPALRVSLLSRAAAGLGKLMEGLDVVRHEVPDCAVGLLHGQSDEVIPPRCSERLHEHLRAGGVDSRLCLTPLLSHGDTQTSAGQLAWGLLPALRCIGHVLRAVG